MKTTRTYVKELLSVSLIALTVLTPSFAFADKENNKKEKEHKIVKIENKAEKTNEGNNKNEDRSCLKAFGHFIAPGWIKKNGTLSISENCMIFLPAGISMKMIGTSSSTNGTTNPSTSDITAPVITSIIVTPSSNRAIVSWKTNERSDTKVFYGITSPVNTTATATLSVEKSFRTTSHKVVLNNLTASTTYFIVVSSKDSSGNVSKSAEVPFTTTTLSADIFSPTISAIVTTPRVEGAKIEWKTNEPADSAVFYGTSTPLNITATGTQSVSSVTRTQNHEMNLANLTASTTYYAVIRSRDASGNVTTSDTFSFTTRTNADISAPVITNVFAVVSSSSVRLAWTTNEPSTTKAYYSTTTPVNVNSTSTQSVESTNMVNAHLITATGLTANTNYNFLIQSKDSSGNTGSINEFSITTAQ